MTNPAPLSHSSASTLLECEQKYYFYKVERAPADPDYQKSDALALGSAFHRILERSRHEKPKSLTQDLNHCVGNPEIGLATEDVPLVAAMVLKYTRLHARMGLKVLAVETEIRTDWFLGYIDAVLEDEIGNWWILDLKTSKSVHLPSLTALPRDPQLNLYAGHHAVVANLLGIDPGKFGGVRWRVATKSTAKQKKDESTTDYVARLTDDHVKVYDIPIPREAMAWDERMIIHYQLWKKSGVLHAEQPLKNHKNCMSYFSPCQYWSRCHGKTFSEMQDTLKITVEE